MRTVGSFAGWYQPRGAAVQPRAEPGVYAMTRHGLSPPYIRGGAPRGTSLRVPNARMVFTNAVTRPCRAPPNAGDRAIRERSGTQAPVITRLPSLAGDDGLPKSP